MTTYLSATYVEQFRCVGEACGAACCRGWSVQLTREDRTRIERALAQAPPPLRPLTNEIALDPNAGASANRPFVIQFNERGECPYVTTDHRCEIHSTMGETALASICAQYPREVAQVGTENEIWASLSCPEAARLCLLTERGADLVALSDVPAPRYVNNRLPIGDDTSDYCAYLDEVRRYMVELLSLKAYPVRTRMFFVAYFAHRISSYFNAQAKGIDRRRLLNDMKAVREPKLLDGLASEFDVLGIPGAYAIALVESIIKSRTGLVEYPEPPLAVGVVPDASAVGLSSTKEFATDPWLQSWTEYCVKRMSWEKDFESLLEQAFENYCKIFWMKEWYTQSPDLSVHANVCMLRVAIIRYRLFGHPALETASQDSSLEQRRAVLERVLLQVVTEVARAIEHDRPFQNSLNAALAKRGMQDLAHASMMLVL